MRHPRPAPDARSAQRRSAIAAGAAATLLVGALGAVGATAATGDAPARAHSPRAAAAAVPTDLPHGVPAAALAADPALPTPAGWPFGEQFPHTSGTSRVAQGADLWADFVYDDHGATSALGLPNGTTSRRSSLAPTQGVYSYPPGEAHDNGADIARSAVGLDAQASYWRVDWNTLTDADVPLAVWAVDTDADPSTGTSGWPAGAGLTSPGSDRFLVVSGTGALLLDSTFGLLAALPTTVDLTSGSFVVRVPRADLPLAGTSTVRLAAGLADSAGTSFAGATAPQGADASIPVYNVGYRSVADEPAVYTDGMTDALVAQAGPVLATGPLAGAGLDGQTRLVTGNFWNEDHQADVLASGGDVTPFAHDVDWSALAAGTTTPEPRPTGYSVRWYTSALDLGVGSVADAGGGTGDLRPNYLGRTQPYTVYVPTTYDPSAPAPLTLLLHSLGVNHNQYSALDPLLLQQLCEDRGSICLTTEGFGPDMWYFDEAEVDVWRAWRGAAEAYALDPEKTVVSGYSMGGWAAYKLGLAHPDLFAGALSLEGPPTCGVEIVPGARTASAQTPHCAGDGDSTKVVASARWVPYVISQGAVDQLVPVTSGLAQVQLFDALDYRYHLELFPAEDHLVYAVQDRFGSLVDALGTPTRAANPGQVSYAWYPDLDVPALGIGTTTAYWLSDLTARDTDPGVVAHLEATSAAVPDPAVTVTRTPSVSLADPTPAGVLDLTWTPGDAPAAHDALTLELTNLATATVDGARAGLACPGLRLTSDGEATLTLTGLTPGGVLSGGAAPVTVDPAGVAVVPVPSGTTALTCAAAGTGQGGTPDPGTEPAAGGPAARAGPGRPAAVPAAARRGRAPRPAPSPRPVCRRAAACWPPC